MKFKQKTKVFGSDEAVAAGLAVIVAGGLDMLGEPPAAWHPVVWYGTLIRFLSRAAPQRGVLAQLLYGIAMLMLAGPIAVLPTLGLHALARQVQRALARRGSLHLGILWLALLEGASLKPFLALRMLAEAGGTVRQTLLRADLPAACQALRSLVSRNCSGLTAELAASAAIESLAENLSDSVVAPLFYYVLFGVPGAAAYRLFNTFDAMVGYHGEYEYLGKVAARLDDVLNLIPARVTALLIIVLAPLFGGSRRAAWRVYRHDAHKTESPNAGHPMAALAGALELRLEKVNHYVLGEVSQAVTPGHIQQAEQMVWRIGIVVMALAAVLAVLRRVTYGAERSTGSARRTRL